MISKIEFKHIQDSIMSLAADRRYRQSICVDSLYDQLVRFS